LESEVAAKFAGRFISMLEMDDPGDTPAGLGVGSRRREDEGRMCCRQGSLPATIAEAWLADPALPRNWGTKQDARDVESSIPLMQVDERLGR
jgi:hypothetical protein